MAGDEMNRATLRGTTIEHVLGTFETWATAEQVGWRWGVRTQVATRYLAAAVKRKTAESLAPGVGAPARLYRLKRAAQ